jgi:hypothetical protein
LYDISGNGGNSAIIGKPVYRGPEGSCDCFIRRLVGALLGPPEGVSYGEYEVEDIGRMTGWISGGLGGTLHVEMTARALDSPEGGSSVAHHNHLGGGHNLATVAHNMDILGLGWWLVVNCVSC